MLSGIFTLRKASTVAQAWVAIGAACLAFASSSYAAEPSGTLIVANRKPGAGSVSLIDLDTETEMARLPIGPAIPHEIAVSPDGLSAVTGEYGGGNNPGMRVVVIDIANARIRGYIDLGSISRPHSFAYLPDNRRVVATLEDADRIALIDVESLAVLRTFPTGGREGHMVRLSPDGVFAYVTSRGAEGTLSVISLREDLPPVVIPTGEGAEGLAVSPDGTEVWVVNRSAETISVVNTSTLEVAAVLPARLGAGRAEISAAGRVFVPNGAAGSSLEKYWTVYDLASRRVVAERRMDEAEGAYSIHVVGERAFVSDRGERSVLLVDLQSLETLARIATDHPDPDGLGYSPVRIAVFDN